MELHADINIAIITNAINLAINNSDMRPQENINYYHNSETGKWHILPWDIDLTFEDAPHLGRGDTSAWERIYKGAEGGDAAEKGPVDEEDDLWYCKACWERWLQEADPEEAEEAEEEEEEEASCVLRCPPFRRGGTRGRVRNRIH